MFKTVAEFEAEYLKFKAKLATVGIDTIHEENPDPLRFKALGWKYDLDYKGPEGPLAMICADDKYGSYLGFLKSLRDKTQLSLPCIRKAVGVMMFVVQGFRVGAAVLAPVIGLRTKAEAVQAATGRSPARTFVDVTSEVEEALAFFTYMFSGWNRVCPVLMGFGPCAPIEATGWHDASTKFKRVGGLLLMEGKLFGFTRSFSQSDLVATASPVALSAPVHECIGQKVWLNVFTKVCSRRRVLLHGDCKPAQQAFMKAFSTKPAMMAPLRASRLLIALNNLCLRSSLCRREWPPLVIADWLSRNEIDKAKCLAQKVFDLELQLL